MDTIGDDTMQQAADHVVQAATDGLPIIHTVTIILNGAHGGADVTITGFTSDDAVEERTVTREVH